MISFWPVLNYDGSVLLLQSRQSNFEFCSIGFESGNQVKWLTRHMVSENVVFHHFWDVVIFLCHYSENLVERFPLLYISVKCWNVDEILAHQLESLS